MPYFHHEGRKLFFETRGAEDAAPVVLVHPFPVSHEAYWPVLAQVPVGLRVIAPDLPGFGQSDALLGPLTMEAAANAVVALLDALGIERATIGGVSMGGYVAMALVRDHGARVAGLVLGATHALADDEAAKERRLAMAHAVIAEGTNSLAEAMTPRLLSADAPEELKERVANFIRAQKPESVAAAALGMALRTDTTEALSKFNGRCAVLAGEVDALSPRERVMQLAELVANATFEVVLKSGHFVQVEGTEQFNRALLRVASPQ